MKILFVTHQRAFQLYGGAETALMAYKEQLNRKGVVCDLYSMYEHDFSRYDVVYIHNLAAFPVEAREILELAKNKGVKTVVSPIFWSSMQMFLDGSVGFEKVTKLGYWFVSRSISKSGFDFGTRSSLRSMRIALECSDAIIVNSNAEANFIKNYFSLSNRNIRIVHNAVDTRFLDAQPEQFINKYGFSDFLLYIGRIEPRKNILNLLRAFNKSFLKTNLVLIGQSVGGLSSSEYWEKCKREASKNPNNIHFLEPIEHTSKLLESAYAASKAFVLPSYFETPGLVALEASLAGTNLAITNRGATIEYFSSFATYINPSDVSSIAKGISAAYLAPKNDLLKKYVSSNFNWVKSSDQLLSVFKFVLD